MRKSVETGETREFFCSRFSRCSCLLLVEMQRDDAETSSRGYWRCLQAANEGKPRESDLVRVQQLEQRL